MYQYEICGNTSVLRAISRKLAKILEKGVVKSV
jgi:hypothetical protein